MARTKKQKPVATVARRIETMETRHGAFSDHAIAQFRETALMLVNVQSSLKRIEARLTERPIEADERTINQGQLDQLYAAVNKIAAMAAAMDETKKTMIKLTSKRIRKLDARVAHLRVRLKRLEG